MEVVDPRSALLCNYEVLTLLRSLEAEQTAKAKANFLVKKERLTDEQHADLMQHEEGVAENLRTIEYEAMQYLNAEYQPIRQQSEENISRLTKALGKYDLTKAEKLQIVNLAPTAEVELYVIVEEIEDRFADSMGDILSLVKASLSGVPLPLPPIDVDAEAPYEEHGHNPVSGMEEEIYAEHDADEDEMVADYEAGDFEGDLEMGDADD